MPAKANIVSHAFGDKANLETALSGGTIDSYDEVFIQDTNEMGWVDADGEFHMHTPRTQAEITVMGNSNIGALKPNDKIPAGTSLEEFIKKLTQVQVPPTYTQPTITIVNNGGTASGNYEAGTSINPVVRATFTKNDAGDLTKISVLKGGVEAGDGGTNNPYDYTGDSFVLGDETVTFTAKAEYGEGEIKNDNLGEPYPTGHIPAGNKTSSNYSYNGQRKAFWAGNVSDLPEEIDSAYIRALANSQLNIGTGQKSIVFPAGTKSIIMALPTGRTISAIRYDESNDNNMLQNFVHETVQVADARGEQNGLKDYNVYTYTLGTAAAAQMTMIFTIA